MLATEIQGREVTLSGGILFKNDPENKEAKSASAKVDNLSCGVVDKKISKSASDKVSNLIVTLSAISRLTNSCDALELYTDSSYIAAGWECGWLDKWRNNGWLNSQGKPVAYAEYWQEIDKKLSALGVRPKIHIMERHPWSAWFENEEKLFREGKFVWTK